MRSKIATFFLFILSSIMLVACSIGFTPPEDADPQGVSTVRAQPVGESVRVGVLAIRSAAAANAQYGGIIAYLEDEIGQPFTLVPVTQEDQFNLVESGDIDFTLNNPMSAVQIQRLYDTRFLATLSRPNTGPQFSGLIIVSADSDIMTLDDLQGVDGTCVAHRTAAAGCNFQVRHLLQNGIDPYTDFDSFTETPSQDNIVLGVLNGTFEVGFVRTGQIERMVSEGVIPSADAVRILDEQDDGFFFPHSTILYPEWPFAALPSTDPELITAVEEALLSMPTDHPAMVNARANGFVSGVDYESMHELIIELELPSFDEDNRTEFSLR